MQVLFIVHATAWSDKERSVSIPIQNLIAFGNFDRIVEIVQSRPDIVEGRYLSHEGQVLQHDEISPVPFFEEKLFGKDQLFPTANSVTLVGGVFNTTGGGCLNVAFDHLVKYQRRMERPCIVNIPIWATYQAGGEQGWEDGQQVKQVTKDLIWKLLTAEFSFSATLNDEELVSWGSQPFVRLLVDTKSKPTGLRDAMVHPLLRPELPPRTITP